MRVLFSCTAGVGHFYPLVPLARASVAAGHDVAFATASPSADAASEAGFEVLRAGPSFAEMWPVLREHRSRMDSIPPAERRPAAFRGRFAQVECPAKLDDLRRVASAWAPDFVVHDASDLAAPAVAASLEVESANHAFGLIVPPECYVASSPEIVELWQAVGLEPPQWGGVYRGAYVDICPPSMQTEAIPDGVAHLRSRPVAELQAEERPAWLRDLPPRPTVYVTLGTVFNDPALFRVLLAGLEEIDCNVIATVGRNIDPVELGAIPANARVERWVPQGLILPTCAATVGHGGSGSTLAALAYGVPLLLVPQGADQFDNAARCAALGAALVLMPGEVEPERVHAGVKALLEQEPYRAGAGALASEIAAMSSPEAVVEALLA